MKPYKYLRTRECEKIYPIFHANDERRGQSDKYLVLHECIHRRRGDWNIKVYKKHKRVVTWNPLLYQDHKDIMIFCPQFMNMYAEWIEDPVPFEDRPKTLITMNGRPGSNSKQIMNARYDIPLYMANQRMNVNAYGTIPEDRHFTFRKGWKSIFRGHIPSHQKRTVIGLHKFSMSFENGNDKYYDAGYITEKIYDCLGCATIPIYWGAPNITDHVPADVFIDYREYGTPAELHKYLTTEDPAVFARMARDGWDFHSTVQFDKYLEVYESLRR